MDGRALRDLLAEEVLLADGGTGTALVDRGFEEEVCDALNLSARDPVREVHRAFVDAGSDIVETNTFGANRFRLAGTDAAGLVAEVNLAGAARARESGARFVAGSIGPLGVRLAPYGRVSKEQAAEAFSEQIRNLVAGRVDMLFLETFSDLAEALVALEAAKSVAPDIATVVTLTFTRDDRTMLGDTPGKVATALAEAGADALGANCSEGPDQLLRVLTEMREAVPDVPLVAQPNAGGPQRLGGRTRYTATADYVARYVPSYLELGARIIGGCCGTAAAHIAALRKAIDDPASVEAVSLEVHEPRSGSGAASVSARGSKLSEALAAGDWIVTVEMEPPHGPAPDRLIAAAETLRAAGATVVNVADSPRAQLRMSPWAAAHLIQREAGIETILHFPTRGRNLLRIQSDLLASHALGIRNLFSVLGDPTGPTDGDLGEVTPSGLISMVTGELNRGLDRSGKELGEATRFTIGCAVNPNAADLDRELRVLKRKQDAGAAFALTQPIYEPSILTSMLERYQQAYGQALDLPLLVGVLPISNPRHADFLHNEVPGIQIPGQIRERVASATDPLKEGQVIAAEVVAELRSVVSGVYLIPAFRRYDAVAELIDLLG